jgi:hypothetical protein
MSALGVKVTYQFLPDHLARGNGEPGDSRMFRQLPANSPVRLVAPLGVGGHPDHLLVRNLATRYFKRVGGSELMLYEDLPYAALRTDLEEEERSITHALGTPRLRELCIPMNARTMARKVFFSRLYFTQSNKSKILKKHAMAIGRKCGSEFAERYYVAGRNGA